MAVPDRLILAGGPGERRIALAAGGDILEFHIDRFDARAGDILLGRLLPRPKGLAASFVDIGEALPGFLSQPSKATEGEVLLVQVTAAARRHKGAALSARPTLPGRWLAYDPRRPGLTLSRRLDQAERERLTAELTPLLREGEGLVARSEAGGADTEQLAAELNNLRRRWAEIEMRATAEQAPSRLLAPSLIERLLQDWPAIASVEVDDPALLPEARRVFPAASLAARAWEHSGAADLLEQSLERRVAMAGGGALVIDETEALTVIDIDGGGLSPMAANKAAMPEIARQMRLRGLAGHLLIDVIPPCSKSEMAQLIATLERALAKDPTPTQVIGATRLGLVELTRERRRPSLSESFLADGGPVRNTVSLALEALSETMRAVAHSPALMPLLIASPPVIQYLHSKPGLIAETQTRLGRPLALKAQDGMAGFTITDRES
jgi:Ribonuclease G/E